MRSGDDRRAFLPLWIRDWNEERQSVETERVFGYSQVKKNTLMITYRHPAGIVLVLC